MEEEERSGSEGTGVDEGKREDQERVRKRERASERFIQCRNTENDCPVEH